MTDHILTLNAGSSSIKFAMFDVSHLDCKVSGQIDGLQVRSHENAQTGTMPILSAKDGNGQNMAWPQSPALEKNLVQDAADLRASAPHATAFGLILSFIKTHFNDVRIVGIGHRVVHGGIAFTQPVIVNAGVMQNLEKLSPLAPLHQPHNLAGITAAISVFGHVPQVACFDTAFHRSHPFIQDTYALPRAFYDEGVRRYGFHGLSYEFVCQQLRKTAPDLANGKVIICHLGNGASVCGVNQGRSVSSSMGFSPLDGLAMGTRSGQLDPAVVLYLMNEKGMNPKAISDLLYKKSGLVGLSGISSDMRVLQTSGHVHAREAIDYFTSRIRREIGGMAAVLEGVETIVFSGGIGENAPAIRSDILRGLGWLGVSVDEEANQRGNTTISRRGSDIAALVIRTNEELMIAQHTRLLISP